MDNTKETKLKVRTPEGYFLQKNLALLPEPLKKELEGVPHAQTPVDPDIIIQGIKNPLITVFIGLSTRKLIDALKRKKKRVDNIIIIEPRLDVFKELIMTEDVGDLFTDPRVDFLVGLKNEELLTELFKVLAKADQNESISRVGKMLNLEKVVDPFIYVDLESSKEAQQINQIVDETIKHLELSMGCPDDQGKRWELMIKNRHNMAKSWNISPMWKKFEGKSAIVLGGGPTLQEFIEAYKAHPWMKNCMIIAADAVLHKLIQNDIKPHIITRCERKKTQIFKGVTKDMTKGIYYAAYPWTPPEFFDLFDDHFYLFRNNGVCVFTGIKHGFVDGGVSSGNAALELALNLGFSNVFLAGIDLCMLDGKTHVEGTQVEFNPENSKAKWTKVETHEGKQEITIPVWIRCRNEYGQSIDKHNGKRKNIKIYQTSKRSAKILGAEFKSWEDSVRIFKEEVKIDEEIEKYREKISKEDIDYFYKTVQEAHDTIKDIAEACRITIELEKDAQATFDNELEKMIRKIKRDAGEKNMHLVRSLRAVQPNIEKLAQNISDVYDTNFKLKYCPNKYYRTCIMDILQHDVFLYENKVNSLANMRDFSDDKFLEYAVLTRDFLDKIEFYSDYFVRLFREALDDNR